jgi:hypothetical protein
MLDVVRVEPPRRSATLPAAPCIAAHELVVKPWRYGSAHASDAYGPPVFRRDGAHPAIARETPQGLGGDRDAAFDGRGALLRGERRRIGIDRDVRSARMRERSVSCCAQRDERICAAPIVGFLETTVDLPRCVTSQCIDLLQHKGAVGVRDLSPDVEHAFVLVPARAQGAFTSPSSGVAGRETPAVPCKHEYLRGIQHRELARERNVFVGRREWDHRAELVPGDVALFERVGERR